jgi:hypothetical protein
MSNDHYYDAGAGAWRTNDDDGWLGERREDDASDVPEWRDREELPEPSDATPTNPAEDPPNDPMDDPAFREALRGQRELSGRIALHGRRRGNHGTGTLGRGIRGLRAGGQEHTTLADDVPPVNAKMRPIGRQLGAPAPTVGRPSFGDSFDLVADLLGEHRVAVLRSSFKKRGANADERAARIYLAVLLRALGITAANRAAAELLGADLRKIGDLRRREYDPAAVEAATQEIARRLLARQRTRGRQTT